jgi:4-oxalocrotonate tautomerase
MIRKNRPTTFNELPPQLFASAAISDTRQWNKSMEDAEHTLRALAQVYFDAAYDMDAEQFQTIFHLLSAVTRIGDDGEVSVMPIETWLAGVRNATAPRKLKLERKDEVVAIDISDNLALVKLRLQMPPRYFIDLLSCLRVQGAWKIVQKVMSVDVRQ